jgi:cation diffusion facilitator family transporter
MTAADPSRADALDGYRRDRAYLGGFLGADHARNERRTWIVAGICLLTLGVQLAGGLAFHSMALTASGLHMAAHVAAMGAAALAYALARRHAADPRFAFGTGKLGDLAGFANAVVLGVVAVLIALESAHRLVSPQPVGYGVAVPLAVGGLLVTLVCVALLRPRGGRDHDFNIAAAHLHLTADAVVGVLAIAGLLAGQRLGWRWADPLAGLLGAGLVAQFALSLVRRAAMTLLDMTPSPELARDIKGRLEADGAHVLDLHLWRLGPGHNAAVAVVAADHPESAEACHARLQGVRGLSHVTIEVRATAASHQGHSHV